MIRSQYHQGSGKKVNHIHDHQYILMYTAQIHEGFSNIFNVYK